jgi:uncharacterized LabA/DUF88 family protein
MDEQKKITEEITVPPQTNTQNPNPRRGFKGRIDTKPIPKKEQKSEKNKHPDQRIAVLVDVQNMYYSAKNLYGRKVNFGRILSAAVSKRRLVRAFAYVIKADVKEEKNFFEALENIGYEVKAKDLQIFYGGAKKGDWDVGIAMDALRIASKVDCVVLVSGDGDFTELLKHLKSMGCRVEIMSFPQTTSSKLIEEADSFTEIDKRYLI